MEHRGAEMQLRVCNRLQSGSHTLYLLTNPFVGNRIIVIILRKILGKQHSTDNQRYNKYSEIGKCRNG